MPDEGAAAAITVQKLTERVMALESSEAAAVLRAETAEAAVTKQDSDWAKLMAEIAKLDPSLEPELGEPDPEDPRFREQYDPWNGLRLIGAERSSLIDDLDLARDEFKRIENYADGNEEIKGLAERGQKKITQNVPVLTQRDNAVKERDAAVRERDQHRESAHAAVEQIDQVARRICVIERQTIGTVRERDEAFMLLGDALLQLQNAGASTFLLRPEMTEGARRDLIRVLRSSLGEEPEKKPGVGLGVVCFQSGRILLGKRHPDLDGGGQWELPGGSLKWGESWEEAARRELGEETGLPRLKDFRFVTAKEDYRPEDGKHNAIIFLSCNAQGVAKRLEPQKSLGWEWFKLDKLPEGPMFPALRVLLTAERELLYARRA
jgi:8-oxo-dGTP diphosphatase